MALSLVISLACLILAAAFKALAESCAHGKNRWSKNPRGFWGNKSWLLKWAVEKKQDGLWLPPQAPTTYYYKLFNLKYKERFFGSATFLVFLTDGYHAAFSMMVSFIVFSVAIWTPWPLWFFIGARFVWGIAFSLAYKWVCK